MPFLVVEALESRLQQRLESRILFVVSASRSVLGLKSTSEKALVESQTQIDKSWDLASFCWYYHVKYANHNS